MHVLRMLPFTFYWFALSLRDYISPFSSQTMTTLLQFWESTKEALMLMSTVPTDVPLWVALSGKAAPVAAMVVFFAPYPTIKTITQEKSVGSLPLLPYSSMIANCFLWTTYGVLKHEIKVWGTNVIGLFLGTYFFIKFAKYAPTKSSPTLPGSVRQHINGCFGIMISTFVLIFIIPGIHDPASIIGSVAVLFCIAMFGSPLAALQTVLQTRSAKTIPLPFTIATVINCSLWSIFGLFDMKDVNIYLPNLLGLAFGLAQVALKLIFGDGEALSRTTTTPTNDESGGLQQLL